MNCQVVSRTGVLQIYIRSNLPVNPILKGESNLKKKIRIKKLNIVNLFTRNYGCSAPFLWFGY